MNDQENLQKMRHSLAHVMAAAISRIYGYENVKFGVGPAINDGFYYDFISNEKIGDKDFAKIEKEMRKIIRENQEFITSVKTISDAKTWAQENNQDFKLELLRDLEANGTTIEKDLLNGAEGSVDEAGFMTNGEYVDLCRGGHLANTGEIPMDGWKLDRMAGAYWRGDEKNPMMSRIYGLAFWSKAELKEFIANREAAKLRDHRKIGRDLDLFLFSELVGPGLPLFTPRGTIIREELAKFSNELREKMGFQKVFSSHITKLALYEKSGHLAKFGEGFSVEGQISKDRFMMKPMNCPHHAQIFASQHRSYREMPVKYLETTTDYRDEKTGELGGLNRVRALTQDDSHMFVRPDQIDSEVEKMLHGIGEMYQTVGMKLRVRLSYRDDSDAYLGDPELWDSAQKQLKNAVLASGLDYFEEEGEAAFYGPKIDFMATDALGREHQLATAQLDFVQPERFELEYSGENGDATRPVMIHSAFLGSIERFMSVYIEHTAGKFPVWVAPEQLRVIRVNDSTEVTNFVDEIREKAFELGVRIFVDDTNNSVGKKIRNSALYKVPYTIVIGDREAESREITPRIAGWWKTSEEERTYAIDGFLKTIANEAKTRVSKTSL